MGLLAQVGLNKQVNVPVHDLLNGRSFNLRALRICVPQAASTASPRMSAISLAFCSWAITNSLALRIARAFSLFCSCDRSWVQRTASPVGLWTIRAAVSTLFTFCPPLPPLRDVVMSRSVSGFSSVTDLIPASSPSQQFGFDSRSVPPSDCTFAKLGVAVRGSKKCRC